MPTMQEEINDAIRKNLPGHLSEELRNQLALIPTLQKNLKDTSDRLEREQAVHATTRAQLAEVIAKITAHDEITKREALVLRREQQASLLEYKVTAADQARTEMRSIISDVFANHRFKYTEQTTMPLAVPGGNNCGGYVTRETATKTVEGEGKQ